MSEQNPKTPENRPQPQYGEYAPEGWQPTHLAESAPDEAATPPAESRRPTGVPHNLGVGGTQQPTQPQAPTSQHAVPQQAAPFQQQPLPSPPAREGSTADRVITIILLVVGAFAALQFALGMLTLGTQIEIIADTLGAENISLPSSITVVQSIGTIVMLSLYAVALIWSVQRLRAKKIAFWVPLSAGVLALILLFVFTMIAIVMVPEFLELSTPENAQRLLQQLEGVTP